MGGHVTTCFQDCGHRAEILASFCGSAGKESTCNEGDLSSIPGVGIATEEEIGYPLQYSWASLGQEDPLEKGTATHSSIMACRISRTEEPGRLQSMGLQRVGHNWVTFTFTLASLRAGWASCGLTCVSSVVSGVVRKLSDPFWAVKYFSARGSLFKKYLFIWLCRVFIASSRVLHCGVWIL